MPISPPRPGRAEMASPESRPGSPSQPSTSRHVSPPQPSTGRDACTRRRCRRCQRSLAGGQDTGPSPSAGRGRRQPPSGGPTQTQAARSGGRADTAGPPAGDQSSILREMERLSLDPTRQRQPRAPQPLRTIIPLGFRLPAMAPPQAAAAAAAGGGAGAISKVLIVMAMEKEAMPLVSKFNLVEAPARESIFPRGAPWTRFSGDYKNLRIDLVMPGKDTVFGVDSVGTVSAALVTYASIQALKPDLIINAGTAGGFKAKGASVKDVFIASDVAFHDRRIPIPVFDMYGVGARKTIGTPNILNELNFKLGKLSTGDSLDMSPQDEEAILNNDATIKDMEGAAVAYVADMFSTPVIFVKAVTDIIDGDKPTAEEFLNNLISVTAALDVAVTQVIDFIDGKSLADL